MAQDPVCGMKVPEETAPAKSQYNGHVYHFCSELCKSMFEREPQKYVQNEEAKSE